MDIDTASLFERIAWRVFPVLKIIELDTKKLAVLALRGDPLGQADADLIREKSREVVNAGIRHLLFDMTEVRHINSAGLGALMAALLTMTRERGTVQFAGTGPHVDKILAMTRLNKIFDIVPSVNDAVHKWAG